MTAPQFVCRWRQLLACIALIAACAVSHDTQRAHAADTAHDANATSGKAAEKTPERPAPVPLAELSARAESVLAELRQIGARSTAHDALTAIEREVPTLARELDARARENARIVASRPSLELLRTQQRSWENAETMLDEWIETLTARIAVLDRDLMRMSELEGIWTETLALAQAERAPPALLAQAQAILTSLARTTANVDAQLGLALTLQSRVAAQQARIANAVELIQIAREATLVRIFTRDRPALWDRAAFSGTGERLAADTEESRAAQWETLESYLERRMDRLLLHSALFVILAALLYWARRRIAVWIGNDPGLARAAAVVAYPLASALILALLASRWIYPQAPRLMWAFIGVALIVPTGLVLRRLAAPYLLPLLYAIVALFFVGQLRAVAASVELVPRLIFVAELAGAAVFFGWYLRRLDNVTTPRFLRYAVFAGCGAFALTAFANISGYVALANLVGNSALRSLYFGLVLYAVVEILDALVQMALRVRPLTLFGMVRRHRELLRRRVRTLLNITAGVWWLLVLLDRLAVRDRISGWVMSVLTAELGIGAINISLADVLAFLLAVWASFLVSRFVRFVLDEEIFPHANLKRGLPYAISRTLHYAILVAGFFVAMGVLGVDMTKFTILAGAFTVGVGFGLQNIFNNFVSGLILLFERPVQVGDVIQMDDAAGVVERIGIRASIVRTPNGSEVIVPNGKLISERLVNWTFSDRHRTVDVGVSVQLGSSPEQVIEILERTAAEHAHVLGQPPPQALLVRVGPDWMGFELRAATEQVEDWTTVRSELAVAVVAALRAANVNLR